MIFKNICQKSRIYYFNKRKRKENIKKYNINYNYITFNKKNKNEKVINNKEYFLFIADYLICMILLYCFFY